MSTRPLFIVIDIDGTLIGDVTPQVCEWELVQKFEKTKIKQFKKSFSDQLKYGLLRPGFTTFVDQIKMVHPNTEFFIYTASETRWANFIVPCIEAVTGVKFSRPLFTRTHCIKQNDEYKKSLGSIAPKIYAKLSQSHSISLQEMLNHTFLIDNSNVILKQEEKSIVLCPTYNFVALRDVTKLIEYDIVAKQYTEMMTIMKSYNMFPNTDNYISIDRFFALHYKHMYQLYSHISKSGRCSVHEQDNFWPVLGSILSKMDLIKSSKDQIVKMINEKLRYKGLVV